MKDDDVINKRPVAELPPPSAAAPAWRAGEAVPHDARRRWIGWALLATLGSANFATPVLMEAIRPQDRAAVIVYACFGLFPLQAVALTAWLVFGRTSLLVRLAL